MKRTTMLSIVVLACLLLSGCTKVSFSLMGQVRNLGNQGIEGVTVELKEEGALIGTALTSSNGIYRIESANAKKDTVVDIQATLGNYSDSAQLVVADSEAYLQDFTFPIPMGTIQIIGHVYDADDNPVEGASIDFLIGTKAIGKAFTDINGYFTMPGLGAVPGDTITINANFGASSTTGQVMVSEQLIYVKDMSLDILQYPIEVRIEGKVYTGDSDFSQGVGYFDILGVPGATLTAYEIDQDGRSRYLGTAFSVADGYYDMGSLFIGIDSYVHVVITKDNFIRRQVDFDNAECLDGQVINAWLHIWGLYDLSYSVTDAAKANLPVKITVYYYNGEYELDEFPDYFPNMDDYLDIFFSFETSYNAAGVLSFDIPVPHWATITVSNLDGSGGYIDVLEGQVIRTNWW